VAKVDIWMPIYIGDYLADTMRLTTEQHGAYFLLLMEHWKSGPLPDDDEELAAIVRLPRAQWVKQRTKLARFFVIEGGTWRQKRLEREFEAAQARRESARESGKKGGRPRKEETPKKPIGKPIGKPMGKPIGKPTDNLQGNPQETSSPSPSPDPSCTRENVSSSLVDIHEWGGRR